MYVIRMLRFLAKNDLSMEGRKLSKVRKNIVFGDYDENYVDEDNNDDYAAFEMRLVYNHLSCWGSSLFSLDPQCDPHITKH